MGKVLVMGSREIEFSEEIQETIYFDNVVAVLYRKDKEIPNNVIFFNFKGKQSRNMGVRPYSTRIKGASLPPMCFSKCLLITTFKSAWTEQGGHWTISELSVCGEASNMKTST